MKRLTKIREAVRSKGYNFMYSVNDFAENHIGLWYAICAGFGVLIDVAIVLLTRKTKTFGNMQKRWFRKLYGWEIK